MSPGGCEYIDIEELLYFRNCKVRPKRNPEVVNLNSLRKTGTVVFQSFRQKRLCYVQAFSDFIQIAVSGLKRLDKPLKHRHPVKCQAARLQFLLSVPGFCLIKNIPGINIIMRNLFDQDAISFIGRRRIASALTNRGAFYPVGLARWHGHYAQRSEQESPA